MAASLLNKHFNKQLNFQTFNPSNIDHLKAYVCLRDYGRQHPTMRFFLEEPHVSIPIMMEAKISDAYISKYRGLVQDVQTMVSKLNLPSEETVHPA